MPVVFHPAVLAFAALFAIATAYVARASRNTDTFRAASAMLPAGEAAEVAYRAEIDPTGSESGFLGAILDLAGAGGLFLFAVGKMMRGKSPIDDLAKKTADAVKVQNTADALKKARKTSFEKAEAVRRAIAQAAADEIGNKEAAMITEQMQALLAEADAMTAKYGSADSIPEEEKEEFLERADEARKTGEKYDVEFTDEFKESITKTGFWE